MEIDPTSLQGHDKEDIISVFIEHVVKTEEEVEEKETRGGKTTDLKLYLLDNQGFEFGTVETTVEHLTSDDTDRNIKNWIADHVVDEQSIDDDLSFLQISTPDAGRTDDFLVVRSNGYFWILTTERKEWCRKTVEKLIQYLPGVERLYLSSDDLEDIVEGLQDAYVSGFTAKYHAPYRKRDATLVFHGAEENDLDKAEEAFDATPSRIEWDQTNSPAAAIQRANTNDGHLSVENVREGSEAKAVNTILGLTEDYQERDRANYEVEHKPTRTIFDDGSQAIDGHTAIELTDPDRDDAPNLAEEFQEDVLSGLQYNAGMWGDDTFFVQDKEHEEVFEIALEPPNIILYARENTTALSFRSFCQEILDEFDSTYSLEKKQNVLVGQ
jgi:hypothetical protein